MLAYYYYYIIILEFEKYQKYEEELRHLLRRNLSPSLRSSSALISEIERKEQSTICLTHAPGIPRHRGYKKIFYWMERRGRAGV